MIRLIVLKPFGSYKRGDAIADKAVIAKILAGPEASFVVRVTAKED